MKIAVSYDNGQVFGHFGHTEFFKFYEVNNKTIETATVVNAAGSGHAAIAAFLKSNDIDVVICGGMGSHAKEALEDAGIEVFTGAEGDADEAVASFLAGELVSEGVNCNHHDHDDEDDEEADSCGCGCGGGCGSAEEAGGCGGGCGGCGGGCGGHRAPSFDGPNVYKKVRVHYQGTFDDGKQFDSSYDRGEPLEFVCGAGMMILGFDKAVATMEVGQIINVHLMPEEAYGMPDSRAIFPVLFTELPGAEELEVGERVVLQNQYGQPLEVFVVAKDDVSVTFDANHELAGKELNFKIELLEVME